MTGRRVVDRTSARGKLGPSVRQPAKTAKTVAPVDTCGTYGGYQQHHRDGTEVCGPCNHAHSVYMGQWRVRSGITKNAQVPYGLLGLLLWSAPTAVEELAEQVLGDAVLTRAMEDAAESITPVARRAS